MTIGDVTQIGILSKGLDASGTEKKAMLTLSASLVSNDFFPSIQVCLSWAVP